MVITAKKALMVIKVKRAVTRLCYRHNRPLGYLSDLLEGVYMRQDDTCEIIFLPDIRPAHS